MRFGTEYLNPDDIACCEDSVLLDTPAASPTPTPTTSSTEACGVVQHLDWNDMVQQGAAYEELPDVTYSIDVQQESSNAMEILMSVDLYLSYLGSSKRDAESSDLDTTYFISFHAFDSTQDQITSPGNCDNRDASDFVGKTWAQCWSYQDGDSWFAGGSLGSSQYLA